jgi:hypothetical protein
MFEHGVMTEQAHLTVARPAGIWRDAVRAYRLMVDGAPVGQIRKGETLRVPISPGRHRVEARIDWTGSRAVEFEAAAGVEVHFSVRPAGNVLNIFWQIFTPDQWLQLTYLG